MAPAIYAQDWFPHSDTAKGNIHNEKISRTGNIPRTLPTILHCDLNGTPQTAQFIVSGENVWCNRTTGEERSVDIKFTSTDWTTVPTTAGTVLDGVETTTFTPGSTPKYQIYIHARVYAGDSPDGDTNSDFADVKWEQDDPNNFLTSFKVGVRIGWEANPSLQIVYENDPSAFSKSVGTSPDLKAKIALRPSDSDVSKLEPAAPNFWPARPNNGFAWGVFAEHSNGFLTGINGTIKTHPFITLSGNDQIFAGCYKDFTLTAAGPVITTVLVTTSAVLCIIPGVGVPITGAVLAGCLSIATPGSGGSTSEATFNATCTLNGTTISCTASAVASGTTIRSTSVSGNTLSALSQSTTVTLNVGAGVAGNFQAQSQTSIQRSWLLFAPDMSANVTTNSGGSITTDLDFGITQTPRFVP